MPEYEYRSPTGETISIFRSMKGKIPESVKRKGVVYTRVFSLPSVMMEPSKPKTLGALAEKNTRQMVKEGKIKPKKNERPFWRTRDKANLDLAKLSNKGKEKYIRTGKL